MPINVGGESGVGEALAPLQPAGDPLAAHPALTKLAESPRPIPSGPWGGGALLSGGTASEDLLGTGNPLPSLAWSPSTMTGAEALASATQLGTISRGPSIDEYSFISDPSRFSIAQPKPPVGQVATLGVNVPGKVHDGRLDLSLTDPLSMLAQMTGSAIGFQNPLIGNEGWQGQNRIDPVRFLAQRDVNILGNAPVRALDYLFAPLAVLANHVTGGGVPPVSDGAGLVKYAFQKDATYWQYVKLSSDDQLGQLARVTAEQYDSSAGRGVLYQSLLDQFKSDRETMLGMTSGDAGVDYVAKDVLPDLAKVAQTFNKPISQVISDYAGANVIPVKEIGFLESALSATGTAPFGGIIAGIRAFNARDSQYAQTLAGLRTIHAVGGDGVPIIGDLSRFLRPLDSSTEDIWKNLRPEDRAAMFEWAGATVGGTSLVAFAAAMAPMGLVLAAGARAAEAVTIGARVGMGTRALATGFNIYNAGLDVLTQAMKVGVGMALTNWGLEIAWPAWNEGLGHEIDMARPISDSPVAAVVNFAGYFASPVEVLGPYLRLGIKPAKMLVGSGVREVAVYRAMGGAEGTRLAISELRDAATGLNLDARGFDLSAKRLTLSETVRFFMGQRVRMWEDVLQGRRLHDDPAINALDLEAKRAVASQDLLSMESSLQTVAADAMKIQKVARTPLGAWATAADREAIGAAQRFTTALEDDVARSFVTDYGAEFWARRGVTDEAGYKAWTAKFMERNGLQGNIDRIASRVNGLMARLPDVLTGGENERLLSWRSWVQKLYHWEYDRNNGLLAAAAKGSEEADRIIMVRQSHLFEDQAGAFLKAARGEPGAALDEAALAARKTAFAQAIKDIRAGKPVNHPDTGQPVVALSQEHAIKALRADLKKPPAPGAVPADPELAARLAQQIVRTEEGSQWWARSNARVKDLSALDPGALAAWVEEVRPTLMARRALGDASAATATEPLNVFHAKLHSEGEWTLAFKPQYALDPATAKAGLLSEIGASAHGEPTFVSVHRLSGTDQFFVSPYLEYPMGSLDNVVIGGQGYLATRLDGLIRGWRTWRITEFQKALTYRVVGRYDGILPSQIEGFINDLARQTQAERAGVGVISTHVGPQALAEWQRVNRGVVHVKGSIDTIAEKWFGSGEFRNLDTGVMETPDWLDIVQKSFRQSQRMNLTAGVTSRLKTLPYGIGDAAILGADIMVPLIRFTLSGVFRVSEWLESSMLNGMRGVQGDPIAKLLAERGGMWREGGVAAQEIAGDPQVGIFSGSRPEGRQTSPLGFYSKRTRVDEANAAGKPPDPPAVDLPGGPDAPLDPAHARYEQAKASLADAEASLMTETGQVPVGTGGTVNQPTAYTLFDLNIQMQYSPDDFYGQTTTEAWRAYTEAEAEFRAARADLPEAEYLVLQEAVDVARANMVMEQKITAGRLDNAGTQLADWLSRLEALGNQAPQHAPLVPGFKRVYHGTPTAFDQGPASTPANLRDLVRHAGPTWSADTPGPLKGFPEEPGYVYAPVYSLDDVRDAGLEMHVADPLAIRDGKWPNGSTKDRREFAESAHDMALKWVDDWPEAIVRVNKAKYAARWNDDTPNMERAWPRDEVSGNLYTEYHVNADDLDYLNAESQWVPLNAEPVVGDAAFAREKANATSLYGPGIYTTDTPGVAKGYANGYRGSAGGRSVVYGIYTTDTPGVAKGYANGYRGSAGGRSVVYGIDVDENLRMLDLEASAPADLVAALEARANQDLDRLKAAVQGGRDNIAAYEAREGPGMTPEQFQAMQEYHAEMRAKYDAADRYIEEYRPGYDGPSDFGVVDDVPEWVQGELNGDTHIPWTKVAADVKTSHFTDGPVGEAGWLDMRTEYGETANWTINDYFAELNKIVEGLGYAGMTHTGGKIMGRVEHKVTIVFDPANARIVEVNAPAKLHDEPGWYEKQVAFDEEQINGLRAEMADLSAKMMNPALRAKYEAALADAEAAKAALAERARAAAPVEPATDLADIPGTPEHIERRIETWGSQLKGAVARNFRKVWSPQDYKDEANLALSIRVMRDSFPDILVAAQSPVVKILHDMGIPRKEWTEFLLMDRTTMQGWLDGGGNDRFDAIMARAERYRAQGPAGETGRPVIDDFYESDAWQVVTSLWRINIQASQDAAFGVHFFNRYRSLFGRSINHPLLGVYPAAWAFKAAKEWFRFLYDNHGFADGYLRLGMSPAVAINHIQDVQNRVFGMTHDTMSYADYIGMNGPFSNSLFIFNLLLPGDWSMIPFPASRSIRMILRNGNWNPADHLIQNFVGSGRGGGIGAVRDINYISGSATEVLNAFNQTPSPTSLDRWQRVSSTLTRDGLPLKPTDWKRITSYPTGYGQ